MYVEVLIQFNIRSLDYTFTYKVPKELENSIEIGKRVKVPFRNKNIEGFILDIKNNTIYNTLIVSRPGSRKNNGTKRYYQTVINWN